VRIRQGEPIDAALAYGRSSLTADGFAVDYLEARSAATLTTMSDARREPLRLLVAAKLGTTRLIDNIAI
jgi:pantoate--beta-alanine ligase